MRILLATGIYPPDAGGPATYTRALARALASQGHSVAVVAYGDQASEESYSVERISRNQSTFFRYWKFMLAVWRRAKEVDVVYLQGPVSEGLPGTLGAILAGKPTVMKVVGDYAWESYMLDSIVGATLRGRPDHAELLDEFLTHAHPGKIGWVERIERWTAKRAKRIITPSHYLKDVVQKWGIPENRIDVIYNGIEPLDQGRNREEARDAFGIKDKRVLLTVVRAVPWKGGDFIINLLPDLPSDVIFAVAGDGPSLNFWKSEAERLHVSDRVRFLGRLERLELAEWYRAADLFILATGYEGFSHVAVEAGMMGLPMYLSDKGGNTETRKMFPTNTKVLPYADREAWLHALNGAWATRGNTSGSGVRHQDMVSDTINVLKQIK